MRGLLSFFWLVFAYAMYPFVAVVFLWECLVPIGRRVAIAVGFGIYAVMLLCMAVVILLGVFGG